MKISCIIILVSFAGCTVLSNKQLYYSVYGKRLVLNRDSSFTFEDVIPNGHSDLYFRGQGTYSIIKDTFKLNYLVSNADSLYSNGRKFSYTLPKYVLKKEKGFLLVSRNADIRFLERNPKF